MEDIKRRVEFENVTVQVQAVQKLYEEVKKKKQKGEPISSKTPEFLELKTLWQLTSVEQSVVARAACQVWLQLVLERDAEFTYVLNGLLNQVPSAKNLQGIVEAVSQLLQIQLLLIEETGNRYQCPYAIRSPPHPFISILTTRPCDSWVLLLQEVSLMFASADKRVSGKALDVLDPFLRYVLLLPQQQTDHTDLRTGLMSALITVVMETEDDDTQQHIFNYLVDMIQGLQICQTPAVFEVSQFCSHLLQLPLTCPSLIGDSTRKLVNFSLTLACRCHANNISVASLTQRILLLGRKHPTSLDNHSNLAMIGQLMFRTYFLDNANLLNIVTIILKTSQSCPPLSVGMVVLPALNILATPKMAAIATQHKLVTSLAADVMALVESHLMSAQKEKLLGNSKFSDNRQLTGDGYQTQMCSQLASQLSGDTMATIKWLTSLQSHLERLTTVSSSLTNLLASILVMVRDTDVSKLTVDRLVEIARQDVSKAPCMLPIFLYCLGKKTCSALKVHLLEALPRIATHKVCVPPILKTIQSLGLSSKLKSTCIRLMTELWSLQDRCFPHLQKLITDGSTGVLLTTLVDDVTLAKAAAIRQVCKLRPEQHGADMLEPLSNLLNTCVDEQGAPVAALALEALFYLCEAEVIDIMSAWGVLESQLLKDTRPVVIEKICELLSLVPSLAVKNEDYEVFLSETVRRLWLYTRSPNSQVSMAAYQALSSFRAEHFKISHLQLKFVQDFIQQAEAMMAEEDQQTSIDSLIPQLPGICYIRMLKDMASQVLDGYEAFLSSMVGKEVDDLPRGIYYTSPRKPGLSANQGKAVSSIPSFIQTQYEKTKLPGLRPGLAAGLLFCYDPPLEVGRDGRPRKHYAMTHGKNYQQMFNTLLHEVPVQTSDWHRLVLMPQAWSSFMERLFSSMLQSRKAEIDLQQSREYIDEAEAEEKKTAAWLWVRSTLIDMIKAATKCNPSIQSNAILALAGLLNIVHRYATSLEPAELKAAESSTEYKSHSHWMIVVIESLMSLVDFQFKPKGELLGLCQQRSADDRLPASLLAQTSASLALAYISPVLITTYVELVYMLLDCLKFKLPGQQSSEELSPLVQVFSGLSLGVLLSQLSLECFGDVCGSEGSLEMMKALYTLEDCCLTARENRTGALLGLSQAIVSMCKEGKAESRAHVSSVLEKLTEVLINTEVSTSDYQIPAMCMCVCQIVGAAFMYNITDTSMADKLLSHIVQVQESNKQNVGVSLSLGLLCHSLTKSGHTAVNKVSQTFGTNWTAVLESQESSPADKLAAVNGLVPLVGAETSACQNDASAAVSASNIGISTVVTMAMKMVASGEDIGLQGQTAWLLGRLYLSCCSLTDNKSAVPTSYSYLPESSVLRSVIDFLLEAGKTGPDMVNSRLIEVTLISLQEEIHQSLPPLNWAALLSPLIRLGFGEKVQTLCLQLAVKQCTTSPTASLFLSSWITPPLFNTLTESSQLVLLRSTGTLVKVITPAVLSVYLEQSCKGQCMLPEAPPTISQALFTGLRDALALPDPPEAVTNLLRIAVADIFVALEKEKNPMKLSGLSSCMFHLRDETVDQILSEDCQSSDAIYRGTFVRCFLVGNGHQPIALLNSCIDAAFNHEDCDRERLLVLLSHCFNRMTSCDRQHARVLNRVQWLLEIMGHVRNIVTGTVPLSNSEADRAKVGEFALNIISSAICLWTSHLAAAVLGLTSDLFSSKFEESHWSMIDHLTFSPVALLPSHVNGLTKEPWSQLLPKFLDWLTEMQDLMSPPYRTYLQESFLCLRDCKDFQKTSVWTRIKLPRQTVVSA